MNKPKSRLGRGLSSLISVSNEEAEAPAGDRYRSRSQSALPAANRSDHEIVARSNRQVQPPAGAAIAELPIDRSSQTLISLAGR